MTEHKNIIELGITRPTQNIYLVRTVGLSHPLHRERYGRRRPPLVEHVEGGQLLLPSAVLVSGAAAGQQHRQQAHACVGWTEMIGSDDSVTARDKVIKKRSNKIPSSTTQPTPASLPSR